MDIKIEELIEKIKKEGIEGAQKTSEEMIGAAENEAEQIRKGARQEAEKIIEKAREETGKFQKNAELAIQQAARDARLLLKEDILKLFDRVFKMEVDKNLSETFLKDLLLEIVGKWAGKPDIEVAVSEKDKEKLEQLLFSGVNSKLRDTITLMASGQISKGFRIGLKGKDVYYDFSDDSIVEMLKVYLNPRLNEILEGNG